MNALATRIAVLFFGALLLTAGTVLAEVEIINPHKEPPEHCGSCHSAVPTPDEVFEGDYRLLKDSIDDTCHVCHPYDCCRLYALKGHNHPSNISKWDAEKFTVPKNLPLFKGLITCNTCHYHRMAEGPNHRMVRLVTIELDKVDWTALCHECHVDY